MGVAPRTAGGVREFRIPRYRFATSTQNYIQSGVNFSLNGSLVLDVSKFRTLKIETVDLYSYEKYYKFNIQDDTNGKSIYTYSVNETYSHSYRSNLSLDLTGIDQITISASGSYGDRDQQCTCTNIVLS